MRRPAIRILSALLVLSTAASQASGLAASSQTRRDVVGSLDLGLLEKCAMGSVPNAEGAIGRNKDGYVGVALQRGAADLVLLGIATGDQGRIETALDAFRYGFDHQDADGGFPVEGARFGMGQVDAGGKASSAAFFLGAVGMGFRLLQESEFASLAQQELETLRPSLRRAMDWLASQRQALERSDAETSNRLVFDALAFTANGQLLEDASLEQIGAAFLEAALQMQRADGVFVEKGGHDSSYQATSLMLLQQYWLIASDEASADRAYQSVATGMAWEKTRILPSGEVSAEGNTRTGLGQEQWLGSAKGINYSEVIRALHFWSGIGPDPVSRELAKRVLAFGEATHGGQQKPSGSGTAPGGTSDKRELLKQKQEELRTLKDQPGPSRQLIKRAAQYYKEAERMYHAGQIDAALRLMDQAIQVLQSP